MAVPGVTTRVISRFTSFLASLRIFHLVADGHAVALLNQPRDVAFGGVVGHAAHGNGRALFLVARGERDLQFARGHHGVFEEQLVEIAQPEHQQRAGDLLLMLLYCRISGVEASDDIDQRFRIAPRDRLRPQASGLKNAGSWISKAALRLISASFSAFVERLTGGGNTPALRVNPSQPMALATRSSASM